MQRMLPYGRVYLRIVHSPLETEESRKTLQAPDFYGHLPLHVACRNGVHPYMISLLLKYDEDKNTPLQEDKVG